MQDAGDRAFCKPRNQTSRETNSFNLHNCEGSVSVAETMQLMTFGGGAWSGEQLSQMNTYSHIESNGHDNEQLLL